MSRIIKANRLNYINNNENRLSLSGEIEDQLIMVEEDPALIAEAIYEDTKKKVEDLLANAEKKTEQMILEGKLMAEALVADGQLELEEKGRLAYEEGYNMGLEKAREEFAEKMAQADLLVGQAYAEKETILKNNEKEIIDFITYSLDKICMGPILDRQVLVEEVAKHLLDYVKDAKDEVILKLAADDYQFLENKEEELNLLLTTGHLSIKIDRSLKAGHSVLISEQGILEVNLEENLERLKAILQDGFNYD